MLKKIMQKLNVEDSKINEILSSMKENNIYITKLENADERYTKLKNKKNNLEEQLNVANNTILELKVFEKDNEQLKGKLANWETEKAKFEKMLIDKDFDFAINKALDTSRAKNKKIVHALLDKESIKLVDNKLVGLDEQLSKIKAENDFLFEKEILGAPDFITGGSNERNSNEKKESFATILGKQKAEQIKNQGLDKFIR